MTSRREIDGYEILQDLKDNLTDTELMTKHKLSSKGLQQVFKQLLMEGAVGPGDIYERSDQYKDDISIEDIRKTIRRFPNYPVPIYAKDPTKDKNPPLGDDTYSKGVIRDIAENGVGIKSIQVEKGDKKIFKVQIGKLFNDKSFEFEAVCRWVEGEGKDCSSGFEITKINKEDKKALDKLIRALSPGILD